jgi:YHS domain-containing protein
MLILALLFYLGYSLYRSVFRSLPGRGGSPPPAKSLRGEEMVGDPQCGTYIPRGDAVEKIIRGKKHYFCSKKCRDAYTGKN